MEKHILQKIEQHQLKFKSDIKEWFSANNVSVVGKDNSSISMDSEFLQFIYDYSSMKMSETDFKKRKRIKNVVPQFELCTAKRANREQCTRRKKTDGEHKDTSTNFCGTHVKGTPHGVVSTDVNLPKPNSKIEVWVKDIKGINYYIDENHNVYNPEDILSNKLNPSIIAKWVTNEQNEYSIPQFNI